MLTHQVSAAGIGNVAANLEGSNNEVFAGLLSGKLNLAFNAFGSGTSVIAGPGPLAIAGSICQNGATVTKVGRGFAIGTRVGGTAAVGGTKTAPASAVRTATKTSTPAAASRGGTRKTAAAPAASVGHPK